MRYLVVVLAVVLTAWPVSAQEPEAPAASPVNPWSERPQCSSMFLGADWQLSHKQRLCLYVQQGVFSPSGVFAAAFSARFSQEVDASSERGDGFATRFGRRFAQNAFKSTGTYLGAYLAREDPRQTPPFLSMRSSRPRGFFPRLGHALVANAAPYRCRGSCTDVTDIGRTFGLSKVLGSLASGASAEWLTRDRPDSRDRALRGAASAYAATFVSAAVHEFRPEIGAAAAKVFTTIFGVR